MSMELYVWQADFDLLSIDFKCLQFLAACKFCALPVTIIHSAKPSSSPTGEFPYFKVIDNRGQISEQITEFPKFVEFLRKCAFQLVLDSDLTELQKAEVEAYQCLLKKTLYPAMAHIMWKDDANYSTVTHKWFSSVMSFPRNFVYLERKRNKEINYVKAVNLTDINIIKHAMRTITNLSNKLGDKKYFFGDKPTSIDALIFGYLGPLLKLPVPSDRLQIHLLACSNLVRFVESILSIYLVIPEEQRKMAQLDKKEWLARKVEAQKDAHNKKKIIKDKKEVKAAAENSSMREVVIFGIGAIILSVAFAVHTGILVFDDDMAPQKNHPWHTVTTAAWRKYPNPSNGNVIGMDVLSQKIDNNVLKSERILQSHFSVPGWAAKLTGFSGTQYSHEYTEIDPNSKYMSLLTRNLNGSSFMHINEKLTYVPHPSDPEKTILKQEASVDVSLPAFTDTCEKAFLHTYSTNAVKGRKGMEWVIDIIKKEYTELTNLFETEVAEISDKVMNAFRHN
uniref:PRELI/MSF1 domain-containing protein n=1 Tax=Rhabditophanes sp. KR3021 TaxID=114890 RepID=A0AC35TQ41_9BILA